MNNKPVILLALSMFVSTVGTNLLLAALAVYVFSMNTSIIPAAGIYVAQFAAVAILMPLSWKLCDQYSPRYSLFWMETISAGISVGIGMAALFKLYLVMYSMIFIRGFFDMTTKVARNVCLKLVVNDNQIKQGNNAVMGSNFLGQAIGAFLGFMLIGKTSLLSISVIDSMTFILSALICLKLPNIKADQHRPDNNYLLFWKNGYQAIRGNTSISMAFFYLLLTVVVMQSFNQIQRTWLPLVWLHLPNHYGALTDVIGCIGIAIGLIVVSVFFSSKNENSSIIRLSFFTAILLMASPFFTHMAISSLALYFIYMIFFEISFMVSMNQLLQHCAADSMPGVMVLLYGIAFGGMTALIYILALITDKLGLFQGIYFIIIPCLLLVIGREYNSITKKRKKLQLQESSNCPK